MFTKEEIDTLKSLIPKGYRSRYRKKISERTGLSIPTIARFFAGDTKLRGENAEKIYDAALEIIIEYREKNESRRKNLLKIYGKDGQQALDLK